MKRTMTRYWLGCVLLFGLALLLVAWLLGSPRSQVDWREVRAIVFESDDWGFCGFIPDSTVWRGLDPTVLRAGKVPEVYWGSTLEDSLTVSRLAQIFTTFSGRDGLPAVFQPNYIMSALDYRQPSPRDTVMTENWQQYDLPALPPQYQRPGLWQAVAEAVARGVWHPELHGAYHYDPIWRQTAVRSDPQIQVAAARGIVPFPRCSRAWELGTWRARNLLVAELAHSLAVFQGLFGRRPESVIAPDYAWDGRSERLWIKAGLQVVQAKRDQRHPRFQSGRFHHRLLKLLARAVARQTRSELTFLERNCRFEPTQHAEWQKAVDRCLFEIDRAWQQGEPAIVETHRINFAHTDQTIVSRGFLALAELLTRLQTAHERDYLFLTDAELAQLYRTGTSFTIRGPKLVIRNLTHSRRLVEIPADQGFETVLGNGEDSPAGVILVAVEPQTVIVKSLASSSTAGDISRGRSETK
ncbi:MAG: hypothetical protein ABIF77_14500 [bacterium]